MPLSRGSTSARMQLGPLSFVSLLIFDALSRECNIHGVAGAGACTAVLICMYVLLVSPCGA